MSSSARKNKEHSNLHALSMFAANVHSCLLESLPPTFRNLYGTRRKFDSNCKIYKGEKKGIHTSSPQIKPQTNFHGRIW